MKIQPTLEDNPTYRRALAHYTFVADDLKRRGLAVTAKALHARDAELDYTPPDSYEPQLRQLRAAAATPASDFATEYKQQRLRALAEEQKRATTFRATGAPSMSAAELKRYSPPNGYEIALAKLRRTS